MKTRRSIPYLLLGAAALLALTGSSMGLVEQTGSLDDERLRPCLAEAGR